MKSMDIQVVVQHRYKVRIKIFVVVNNFVIFMGKKIVIFKNQANGTGDDLYVREKPPKLGKSLCRKFNFSMCKLKICCKYYL